MPFAIRRLAVKTYLTFLGVAILTSPVFGQTHSNKYGGQVVRASVSDPKSFNDIVAQETSTTMVTTLIYEGLVNVNGVTLKEEPQLAERWEVSADGLQWTFYLRHNVVWNDGHPFNA